MILRGTTRVSTKTTYSVRDLLRKWVPKMSKIATRVINVHKCAYWYYPYTFQ